MGAPQNLKSRQRTILVDLEAEPFTSVNIFENFDLSTPRMHAPRLPVRSQLKLWATPGAHTWRGPSHDTLELLNPEGFSFKALVQELEAQEHRKRIIDASRFRGALRPVPDYSSV